MNKEKFAKELLLIAKDLAAEWAPVRKDVDVGKRNVELLKSLSTYAPGLGKELRARVSKLLAREGYEVSPRALTREWSQYLGYIAPETNNNKYHYYAVYSFDDPNGETLYVAANCSGRIGIIERAYDLTEKYLGGPATSLARAISAAEKHLKTKTSKGYEKVKMTRG